MLVVSEMLVVQRVDYVDSLIPADIDSPATEIWYSHIVSAHDQVSIPALLPWQDQVQRQGGHRQGCLLLVAQTPVSSWPWFDSLHLFFQPSCYYYLSLVLMPMPVWRCQLQRLLPVLADNHPNLYFCLKLELYLCCKSHVCQCVCIHLWHITLVPICWSPSHKWPACYHVCVLHMTNDICLYTAWNICEHVCIYNGTFVNIMGQALVFRSNLWNKIYSKCLRLWLVHLVPGRTPGSTCLACGEDSSCSNAGQCHLVYVASKLCC